MKDVKTAVVLFQLGGPDSTDAVEPFLYNLFCDPDIIDFPGAFLGRRALAKFISSRRSRRVRENYRQIGGRSPIMELTSAQAEALGALVGAEAAGGVHVAMRYWKPFTADALAAVRDAGCGRVVLLPLYPHYSKATTFSSLREWNRQCDIARYRPERVETVCCFFNHPLYIDALVRRVNETLPRFGNTDPASVDLVFSAHGVPESLIRNGDPYQLQIEETVRLVMQKGGWTSPHTLCYQSKVGPARWLEPSLTGTVARLASAGRKNLLIVPVSFVTDHIETLHEINIEVRTEAVKAGIERFEMTPALNDCPEFISCLADLVLRTIRTEPLGLGTCRMVRGQNLPGATSHLCPHWADHDRLNR